MTNHLTIYWFGFSHIEINCRQYRSFFFGPNNNCRFGGTEHRPYYQRINVLLAFTDRQSIRLFEILLEFNFLREFLGISFTSLKFYKLLSVQFKYFFLFGLRWLNCNDLCLDYTLSVLIRICLGDWLCFVVHCHILWLYLSFWFLLGFQCHRILALSKFLTIILLYLLVYLRFRFVPLSWNFLNRCLFHIARQELNCFPSQVRCRNCLILGVGSCCQIVHIGSNRPVIIEHFLNFCYYSL